MAKQALPGVIWPVAASTVAVLTTQGFRAGRRRSALNEALHELRRPLQAMALSAGGGSDPADERLTTSVELAAGALERLEQEVNGGGGGRGGGRGPDYGGGGGDGRHGPVDALALVNEAIARWRPRADIGAAYDFRPGPLDLVIHQGDRHALAQALDNLIVNAIEHGGPHVSVRLVSHPCTVGIEVVDAGGPAQRSKARPSAREAMAKASGRARRGHGLTVVRRVAAEHCGCFELRQEGEMTVALLELPRHRVAPSA